MGIKNQIWQKTYREITDFNLAAKNVPYSILRVIFGKFPGTNKIIPLSFVAKLIAPFKL